MKCSSCNKKIEDIRVNIGLNFDVKRMKTDGTWEDIPNSIVQPKEILCQECFSEFVDIIEKTFNKEK